MKKRLAAILCMSALCLTACGDSDVMVLTPKGDAVIKDDGSSSSGGKTSASADQASGTTASADNDKKEEQKTEEKADTSSDSGSSGGSLKVGFAQVGAESDWRLAQTASMKETFTAENGYDFTFVDCNNDPDIQKQTIQKFVDDKLDYIVLDPIIEDGYDDVLKKAKDAGIPVIVVDRNISADPSLYSCWVGSDFTKEGEDAGKWLADYLDKNNRGSEDINIVTIQGTTGASAEIGRTEGMDKVAAEHGNWKMLDKQSGDFTEEGGKAVMTAYLKKYDDIDVVVCQNDNEAFGAVEAIEAAGKSCGPKGDMIMISFDATKGGFQYMIDGKIHVDVECNPIEGPFVSELIQKLEKGEKVDSIQYMEEGVFAAEDAASIIDSRAY